MRGIFTWFRNLLFGSSTSSGSATKSSTASALTVPKRCYEILLPLTHNDGRPMDPRKFQQTRDELADAFGGSSFSSETITGIWFHRTGRYADKSRCVFVDVDDTPENRAFFAEYKLVLQE